MKIDAATTGKVNGFLLFFTVAFCVCLVALTARGGERAFSERLPVIEKMYGEYRDDFPDIGEVSAPVLMEWMDSLAVVIVDVRKRGERKVSMIPNSITAGELDAYLEHPSGGPIVVYCTIGYRSGKYVRSLMKKKSVAAYNLEGGILAWVHHGGTVEKDGKPTRRVHVYGKRWSLLPEAYEAVW